jgi:hypothetical protein
MDQYWYKLQKDKRDLFNCRNVRVNSKYFAMPWQTGGGSAVLIQSLDKKGRTEDKPFCVHGHSQQVTTFDLNWLDESLFASGSGDGVAKIYKIPDGGLKDDNLASVADLKCDGRLTVCNFSKTVPNLLATADTGGSGHIVRLWDVQHEAEGYCGFDIHKEVVTDVAFDYRSVLIATIAKDKTCNVIDPRADQVVQTFECDNASKDPQCLWIDDDHVLTLGGDKTARRSIVLWQVSTGKKLKSLSCGMDSATMLPHYDYDSKLLYLGHFGGRIINIYHITSSAPYIEDLNKYQNTEMTGLAFFHKSTCDVTKPEVARCLKLGRGEMRECSFTVPRKRLEFFQDDLFPPTWKLEAVCDVQGWFNGECKEGAHPGTVDLRPAGMPLLSEAPAEELTVRQMRYKEQLLKEDEPEAVSHLGKKTAQETQQHFIDAAASMPTRNRWDAAPAAGNDVDSDEWSDSD